MLKLNFKIKVTICLQKSVAKKRRTSQENKQTNKTTNRIKKGDLSQPKLSFQMIFHRQFTDFCLKNLFSKHYSSTLCNDIIYHVPFLCKINCFLCSS